MIRIILMGVGFLAITAALLVFQPGARPRADQQTDLDRPDNVTRTDAALDRPHGISPDALGLPQTARATPPQDRPEARLVQPAHTQTTAPRESGRDDGSMRQMTWQALANLNRATGRDVAPGQPGSLLYSIVQRSLDPALRTSSTAARSAPQPGLQAVSPPVSRPASQTVSRPQMPAATANQADRYVVQPGDSLMSIAQALYGDVNMTGPLFAANQALLSRPDDLRPGQELALPPGPAQR